MTQYKNLFGNAPVVTQPSVVSPSVHSTQTEQLPVVSSSNPLVNQIRQTDTTQLEQLGERQTQQLVALSAQLLAKTRATDTGEFGRGMNDILRLMNTVQYDQLGEPSGVSGLINKVKRSFNVVKVDVVQAFDTAKGQIDKISADLHKRLTVIESDINWLRQAYSANLADMQALEQLLPAVEQVRDEAQQALAQLTDHMQVAEQRQRVDQLGRRAETIALQIHQAKLRALQIKGLENANMGILEDFRSLLDNALPAWGTEISMGLLSQRQKANIDISNRVKDQIQTSMKRAADQIHDNVINSEKALQRQAVDVPTLQHIQDKTIDMIRQKIQLVEQRDQQRAQTMQELSRMDAELKQSLLDMQEKKPGR